ncbi:Protein ATC1/LIC4 [Candida viswanathii]|uniref:Protein ATC1/LIC4 n=1 Tax=Candida viswanathii TaxID=5486 RepID=A0A367XUM1_9ASCO|nr:Protein ATC1/LIC4 [Candida viswanathii]
MHLQDLIPYNDFTISDDFNFDIEAEINKIMAMTPMSTPLVSECSPVDSNPVAVEQPEVNLDTVSYVKSLMIDNSKIIGLYSTLKTTYLKLCKEFNYLLQKFNDNEKIKMELIQENEELKKLVADLLKDKEMENLNARKKRRHVG